MKSSDQLSVEFPASLDGGHHLGENVFCRLTEPHRNGITGATGLKKLVASIKEIGTSPRSAEEYLQWLVEDVVPYCVNMQSSGCLAHMSGIVPNFVPALTQLLVSLNQNHAKQQASPAFSLLEQHALAAMHEMVFGFSSEFYQLHRFNGASTLGVMAGGGTIANMTAIWVARNQAFPANGDFVGVESAGLQEALRFYGWRDAVVVGSELMHYSFEKAMSLAGFGTRNLVKVPVDANHRLVPDALEKCLAALQNQRRRVIAIVGVAGTTDSGSIDPLRAIAQIAAREHIHFHVDAAWGGAFLFSRRRRRMLAGIEFADTITIDGHKQMHLPIGTSMLLFRDPGLARVIEKQSHYMLQDGSGDLGRRSLEGSRDSAGVFLHAALMIIGAAGYEEIVEAGFNAARQMADSVRGRREFQLLMEPETNLVLYRFLPAAYRTAAQSLTAEANQQINWVNQRLQQLQFETGRTLVSRTTITNPLPNIAGQVVALRAIMSNPSTLQKDIDALLNEQTQIGNEITVTDEYLSFSQVEPIAGPPIASGGIPT